jgi:hypothetical protein
VLRRTLIVGGSCLAAAVLAVAIFARLAWMVLGKVDIAALGRCTFENPSCSAGVASWALFFATLGAFIAATAAAVFASAVYGLETCPRLGQSLCLPKSVSDPVDLVRILTSSRELLTEKPPNFDESKYSRIDHEFHNLGRLPLVGVSVRGTARFARQPQSYSSVFNLGNIGADRTKRLTTFFAAQFGLTKVTWDPKSARQGDGTKILFHPAAAEPRSRLRFDLERPGLRDEDFAELVAQAMLRLREQRKSQGRRSQ